MHGLDVDGASQQHEPQSQQQQQQQKHQSRQPRLSGRRHTEVTPAGAGASANVSPQQSSRKSKQRHSNHQLADAKDFALRVGESDESGDSDSENGMSAVGRN